ncbi:hypothetical protein DMN91_006174 [Ooceraea biroi]|uniref:Small ribosomal subunit protein mS26 n=1 Tax=Ooceraea biroi TaxID=2015173 RepID=A0A026X510_OOCBI|nr:probable 28S ribosomal protein S26, mitochondrial [Ooceraea biroi]EZA62514.1 putative 28S ribosomal protein S26, mitochondrial [Ooceraea biroi]RLU21798.1 hypothetical protein DMN91_006174 [Ooceraea biroi]
MQVMRVMNANALTMSTIGFSEFIPNSVYTQCVRWKRKPIWLPPAKSKLFRVPKKPVIPDVENQELQSLFNHYRTYMTSLRTHIEQVQMANRQVQFDKAVIKQMEEEDFQACSAINDEWNAKIAEERTVRLAEMRKRRKENILERLVEHEERQARRNQRIDECIRKAKEEAPTFITAENVDAAIEACLENVVDHNRALDLNGEWHVGKYPPVSNQPAEETQTAAVAEQ